MENIWFVFFGGMSGAGSEKLHFITEVRNQYFDLNIPQSNSICNIIQLDIKASFTQVYQANDSKHIT